MEVMKSGFKLDEKFVLIVFDKFLIDFFFELEFKVFLVFVVENRFDKFFEVFGGIGFDVGMFVVEVKDVVRFKGVKLLWFLLFLV